MRKYDATLPIGKARGPLVYAWMRGSNRQGKGGACLYVGMSSNGLHRPTNPKHHQIAQPLPTDRLLLWYCPTLADARALERQLIHELRPVLNRHRSIPRQPFTPEEQTRLLQNARLAVNRLPVNFPNLEPVSWRPGRPAQDSAKPTDPDPTN